jgi:hypothetical protein
MLQSLVEETRVLFMVKYISFHENKISEQYATTGAVPYAKCTFRTHSLPQSSKLTMGVNVKAV